MFIATLLINFLTFIYFWERERVHASRGGAETEGDTESEAGSRFWAVSTEPNAGLKLMNHKIMTWGKVGSLTHWATQAPLFFSFFKQGRFQHVSHTEIMNLVKYIGWKNHRRLNEGLGWVAVGGGEDGIWEMVTRTRSSQEHSLAFLVLHGTSRWTQGLNIRGHVGLLVSSDTV